MKRKLLYFGIFLLLALGWFLYQLFGPNSKVRLGATTTFITEPLAEDGLPNYVLAIDQIQREGVTAEKNGALPFLRAMGPQPLTNPADFALICDVVGLEDVDLEATLTIPEDDREFRESLGIELAKRRGIELRDKDKESGEYAGGGYGDAYAGGEYGSGEYGDFDQVRAPFALEIADSFLHQTQRFPWTVDDSPQLAQWVTNNKRPLDWLVEAGDRPQYYCPSITALRQPKSEVIGMLLPYVQASRSAARCLTIRCQFHLGAGKLNAAWKDIRGNFRLGQHISSNGFLVEQLVGIAIQDLALRSLSQLLDHEELPLELAKEIQIELSSLRPRVDIAKGLDTAERCSFLDFSLRVSTGRLGGSYAMETGPQSFFEKVAFDANQMLKEGNRWYDRLVSVASLESRAERQSVLRDIDNELSRLQKPQGTQLLGVIFSRNQRTQVVSDMVVALMLPAAGAALTAADRGQAQLELAQVATALAIYKLQYGQYPETLDALSPEILEKVPEDLFAAAPLTYRRVDDGYVLYSVGENETDDHATNTRWLGDDEPFRIYRGEWLSREQWRKTEADPPELSDQGDDLVIRLPMPKYEWPKAP